MSTSSSRPSFMGRGMVFQGDKTSHGGIVLSGFAHYAWDGIPVARLGDQVYCPRCTPHQQTIAQVTGFTVHGVPMATAGDITSCGAVLLAEASTAAELTTAARASLFAQSGTFDQVFHVTDDKGQVFAHHPYRITLDDGRVYTGTTDAQGRTQRIFSDAAHKATLEVPFYGDGRNNLDSHGGHDTCQC